MEMNQDLYEELICLAKEKGLAIYSDIAPKIGLSVAIDRDREKFADFLTDIARHEDNQNRPMLTALIVQKGEEGMPSEGFFHLAQEFGLFDGSTKKSNRRAFWEVQKQKVYEFWRDA